MIAVFLVPLVAFFTFVLLGLTVAVALALTVALVTFIAGLWLGTRFSRASSGPQFNQTRKKTTFVFGRNVVCTLTERESSTVPDQIAATMRQALHGCRDTDQAYAIAERLNSGPRWLDREAGQQIVSDLRSGQLHLPSRVEGSS